MRTLSWRLGNGQHHRITGQRIWKIIKAVGTRAGIPALHPQRPGPHLYADEACFTEIGPDRDHTEGGYEKIVTAPNHAAMCAAPTIP